MAKSNKHDFIADGSWYSCRYCGAGGGSPKGNAPCTKNPNDKLETYSFDYNGIGPLKESGDSLRIVEFKRPVNMNYNDWCVWAGKLCKRLNQLIEQTQK